jgi:hypothetical protein
MGWFYNADLDRKHEFADSAQPIIAASGWFPTDPPAPVEIEANEPADLDDDAPEVAAPEADQADKATRKSKSSASPVKES